MPDESLTLDSLVFKQLQVALLQQQLVRYQTQDMLARAEQAVMQAARTAGLDPTRQYRLDPETSTVSEIAS